MPHPSFPDPNPSWADEPRQALAFFDGTFDNQVFTTSMCSWHDLRDMLQDRLVTTGIIDTDDDKNVMMITAALYRRHDDPRGYDPAPQKVFERDAWGNHVLDPYGQKVVREIVYPIDPETGKPFVQRSASNTIAYTSLFIDYDGRQTIRWARERFARYAHVGYTSYSHLKDGRVHKFRIVIPFREPIPVREYEARRTSMLSWLDTDDPSTLAIARGFFVPSCHRDRLHLGETWIQEGEPLDWGQFRAKTPWVPPSGSVSPAVHPIAGTELERWGEDRLEKQLAKIRYADVGGRHDALVRAARAVGSDVAAGAVKEWRAEQALMHEALTAMGEGRMGEIRRAIESGFRIGVRTPTPLPESCKQTEMMARLLARLKK
jgi:hypothetical protein